MEVVMRKSIIAIMMVAIFICVSACSTGESEDYAESTIVVAKKGRISERIIESFDKDYYSIDELQSEFESSVSQYNDNMGSEEIKLKKIELNGTLLTVDLDFTGPSDYENFTGETMFIGTVGDAYDNGYTMDVTLKGVEKGDKIEKVQIMGLSDKNIIIMSEHVRVRTFDDIAYVSANVDVVSDKEARILSESDGLAYIILK